MSLADYGWSPFFQAQLPGPPGAEPGRVRLATVRKAHVYASGGMAEVSVPRNVGPAAVGDWLLFDPSERTAVRILERRNVLARNRPGHAAKRQILASNVDAVLVVAGLDRELSARQIERYLICVRESGAKALVALNKADLCNRASEAVDACARGNPGIPVVATSIVDGRGLADLQAHLPERATVALAGPSGAGKSSLVNALLQADHLKVGTVRSRDRRGRHTTTRRELIAHPNGTMLMDIPGIREIYPWSRPETVDAVFGEIAGLAQDCLYRDCRHDGEPRCAVRQAVSEGRVDTGRMASYRTLRLEQEELARSIEAARKPAP